MERSHLKIVAIGMGTVVLIALWIGSYFSVVSLRWTNREIFDPSSAAPGTPAAETWEIATIQGRWRWMHAIWLATPHVPANGLEEVPRKNGLSVSLRDRFALPLNEYDLDWHFVGFGFGHPTFFRQGGAVDSGMDGLWQVNSSELCVPIWFLIFILLFPLLRSTFQRPRKWETTHCSGCGYDLRATPERCPECGKSVVQR